MNLTNDVEEKLPYVSDEILEFLEKRLSADRLLDSVEMGLEMSEAARYGFILGARAAVGALRAAKILQEPEEDDE